VTLGGDGVIAIRDGVISRAKGLKIEPVDTVGAGDTFCGYFAASLDEGLDFEPALRRAAVAGSLACLKQGAQPSIPLSAMTSQTNYSRFRLRHSGPRLARTLKLIVFHSNLRGFRRSSARSPAPFSRDAALARLLHEGAMPFAFCAGRCVAGASLPPRNPCPSFA
jgi:hypothetical protein